MFQTHKVNEYLYRVTYNHNLAGYIQVIQIIDETRFRSRLVHRRHAKLGAWVGEFFTFDEAIKGFGVFEDRLKNGPLFDMTERKRSRNKKAPIGRNR